MGAGVPVRRRGDGSGDYKFIVEGMYKKVKSIQEYPLLKMWSVFPGVVKCRTLPTDEPVLQDLRRVYDQVPADADHAKLLLAVYLTPPRDRKLSLRRRRSSSKKIRPHVPVESQSDSLYTSPSAEQEEKSRAINKLDVSASSTKQTAERIN
ncbi:hypothetical protein GN958_ATG20849 [Phytophthora infestans]|uniref:Uncharacterized protein n=1 Tax=Phytophthora infestans TaxID=4787 RepID=A0A8S9TSN9_PHYIN|nr:hypothetical protein GN958_ATG20849 [Phytophthora infestans]